MRGFFKGTCTVCKTNGLVADVDQRRDSALKEFYYIKFPQQLNKINKLCVSCYGKLFNKYYKKYAQQKNSSSTNTMNNSTTSSSLPSTSSTSSNSLSTSNSYQDSGSQLSLNSINTESINSINNTTQSIDSNPCKFPSNSSDSATSFEKRQKPMPLSKKMERRLYSEPVQEEIIEVISSDEDVIEPDIRCPTYQPLIKRRRTPVPLPVFNDHNAPIFDTSRIFGPFDLDIIIDGQPQAAVDMHQIHSAGPFLYYILNEENPYFSYPYGLTFLAKFILNGHVSISRQRRASELPLIDIERGLCLLVGIGIPPICENSPKNFFGKAFEQAATKSNTNILQDFFDTSLIQIKQAD